MTRRAAIGEIKAVLWRLENNKPVIWEALQEAIDFLHFPPLWMWEV